jgi:hypothetical protein
MDGDHFTEDFTGRFSIWCAEVYSSDTGASGGLGMPGEVGGLDGLNGLLGSGL